jgi:hypothetical protein
MYGVCVRERERVWFNICLNAEITVDEMTGDEMTGDEMTCYLSCSYHCNLRRGEFKVTIFDISNPFSKQTNILLVQQWPLL